MAGILFILFFTIAFLVFFVKLLNLTHKVDRLETHPDFFPVVGKRDVKELRQLAKRIVPLYHDSPNGGKGVKK